MRTIKQAAALIMVCLIVLSAMPLSFAAMIYTDVPDDHWAAAYILKVAEHEIMKGYPDATFRPTQSATKLETIAALYNAAVVAGKTTRAQGASLALTHKDTLDMAKIPDTLEPYGNVVREAAAYALEHKILHPDELKGFVVDGELAEVNRLEACVFVGKALNVYLKENTLKIISFDYTDQIDITQAAAPYVDLLIEYGVISGKGDVEGKFNAKLVIGRDVLATMIAGAYDVLSGEADKAETDQTNTPVTDEGMNTTPIDTGKSDRVFEASISLVHTDIGLIELRDGGGKLKVYDTAGASFMMNGSKVGLSNLSQGLDVTVYEKGGKLSRLVINNQFDAAEGTFKEVSSSLTDDLGAYRVLTMEQESGSKKYYKLYDSLITYKDGETASLEDLAAGDRLLVKSEGYIAREIEAFSENSVVSGVVNRTTDFKAGSTVSIQLQTGKFIDEVLEQDLTVVTKEDEIRKGDIVNVTLKYGKLTRIEATGLSSELTGTISEIIISAKPRLTLHLEDGTKQSVYLKENVTISKQGEMSDMDMYDLRLEQNVTLDMDATGATAIVINKSVEKVKFTAEVLEVHRTTNLLKVQDAGGNTWVVGMKDNTTLSILDYEVGDTVFVYGVKLSDDLFEAEMIIDMD